MTEAFGFSGATEAFWLVFAVIYLAAVHSPVLLALIIVWFQRKSMRRRILFAGTVMGATYGLLSVFFLAAYVPLAAFMLFFAPTLIHLGYLGRDSVLVTVADFVAAWWWALLPVIVLITAIFVSRYFASRWNRIVEALG
ncbi:MAG: hypothetical protein LBE62_13675 [Azonexus sp.]|jgi:hypothetical protein|nr:hypothetical protein [Azonexus sp.]